MGAGWGITEFRAERVQCVKQVASDREEKESRLSSASVAFSYAPDRGLGSRV